MSPVAGWGGFSDRGGRVLHFQIRKCSTRPPRGPKPLPRAEVERGFLASKPITTHTKQPWRPASTRVSLRPSEWVNRIMDYNPGKFDKSALVKHYAAHQLGKFQEGGNIQLIKALKGAAPAKTPAKTSKNEDVVNFITGKSIKKTPSAPAPGPSTKNALEIEKFLPRLQLRTASRSTSTKCPGGKCRPAPYKKKPADDLYSDDSDLE